MLEDGRVVYCNIVINIQISGYLSISVVLLIDLAGRPGLTVATWLRGEAAGSH